MCEINIGFYFFPLFVLNAFSILIFATALFQFGHFSLARFIYGVCISLHGVCIFFITIGFISHVGSRQVS